MRNRRIYATLGVFLIRAAREPKAHLSLIWFTVWSSAVHGGIMAAQAIARACRPRATPPRGKLGVRGRA